MKAYQDCFESLSQAWRFEEDGKTVSKSIACMKAALKAEGILAHEALAPGTKALDMVQRQVWMKRYREVKDRLAALSPVGWVSKKT
jgi:hypothetical protein